MTQVKTNLRNTRERARELRFEPTGSLSQTNVQKAIEQVATQPPAVTPTSVAFAQSPYTVLTTDTYIEVDTSGGAITINLGVASGRNGVPLTIKDVTGHANANNITITPNGTEKVDSLSSLVVSADFGAYRLVPKSGTGYRIDA